jgi:hypothetical protein
MVQKSRFFDPPKNGQKHEKIDFFDVFYKNLYKIILKLNLFIKINAVC